MAWSGQTSHPEFIGRAPARPFILGWRRLLCAGHNGDHAMCRAPYLAFGLLCLLLCAADPPPEPARQWQALRKEIDGLCNKANDSYSKAKTGAERRRIHDEF